MSNNQKSAKTCAVWLLAASMLGAACTASPQTTVPEQGEYEAKLKAATSDPSLYPSPPEPHYGPEYGSIVFVDIDPGPTIGGQLIMRPAVDASGDRVDEASNGISMYMIHWGLEVGEPGVEDDEGAGDLGGDCMGFRDTSYVAMKSASEVGEEMVWEIPHGTIVPKDAVYFVGHTIYGRIHNLNKCTQTPIHNLIVPGGGSER